jgi:hypothetical protein
MVGYAESNMSTSHETLKLLRKVHLYFGLFISPAVLFFAFTGALQTFSLHETTRGSSYKPPAWAVTLGQIHKKQTSIVPVRKAPAADAPRPARHDQADSTPGLVANGKPAGKDNADLPPAAAKIPDAPAPPPQKSHLPLKIFFLIVAIGLFTSTLTGIYMAYKFTRNKLVVTAILLAGIIIPPLLLPF